MYFAQTLCSPDIAIQFSAKSRIVDINYIMKLSFPDNNYHMLQGYCNWNSNSTFIALNLHPKTVSRHMIQKSRNP